MIPKSKVTVIDPWTEINGLFIRLEEREGELFAEISEQIIVLPFELKDAVIPLLGHRIAILRTDIPGREYLVHVLTENKPDEREDQCGICETVNRGHKLSFVAMLRQNEVA
jgi:hypothetical protein